MAITDNIIGAWNFNELAGANCDDAAPPNHDGTADGASINSSTQKLGAACRDYDGIDDEVLVGDFADYENLSALSISLWFKLGQTGALQQLISKENSSGDRGLGITITPAGLIVFLVTNSSTGIERRIGATAIIDTIIWHHLVCIFSSSTKMDIWLDGNLDNGALPSGIATQLRATGTPLRFGRNSNVGPLWFKGSQDAIYMWNRDIIAGEVGQLWNGGAGLELFPSPAVSAIPPHIFQRVR